MDTYTHIPVNSFKPKSKTYRELDLMEDENAASCMHIIFNEKESSLKSFIKRILNHASL